MKEAGFKRLYIVWHFEKAKIIGRENRSVVSEAWVGEIGYNGHGENFEDNLTILYIDFNG